MDKSMTEEEIFTELEKYFGSSVQPRKSGDIDIDQIAERFQCSIETVRTKMNKAIKEGNVVKLRVYDTDKNDVVIIYRRI